MLPLKDIDRQLQNALRLSQPAIGVAFADRVPTGVPCYSGVAPAGCLFWQHAAGHVFATVPRDHEFCSIGMYTHHLQGRDPHQTDLSDTLKVFGELGYVRSEDMPFIPVLARQPKAVIYGPLSLLPADPDVVLLFVQASQSLILSEASQQIENGLPPAMGRPACGVIPQAYNTGRTALSLGCCGARAYLDILTADVALYAIPGVMLEAFTERVVALSRANEVLTSFHKARRRDIEAGNSPTVRDSLNAFT
jgi:uncharacterized protein (DUF169 family)